MISKHKCPVCGNSQSVFALCEVNGFSVYGCTVCGADHVFPMPRNELLKAYYDREKWFEGGEVGGYQNYDQQTAWSVDAIKPILEEFEGREGLSVLDVGCGYGTHLELAANLGWKCFGVEVSDHARHVAQRRLEGRAYIVETIADLIPHEFDLVLMLDVVEHLPSPYTLFYNLFSIGAITPKTRIVISTPNAGSDEARQNPAGWSYRHPPSHLVYYSAESLRFLLEKLHFSHIDVQGVHSLQLANRKENEIAGYGGLVVTATGSDFTEFMRERYVPGTWSKIAEYEHFPRYELAKTMVAGKSVLDFGCGTGYGSALLSEVAANVMGLDIDQAAISWANATHHNPGLTFHRCSDLGSTLPSGFFDAVTCFEMIEHVDYETQQAVITSIARLLCEDGLLIISTPNPEITKLYGANPYHLREMTLPQFHELLAVHFPHIHILEQRVRNSIAFDEVAVSRKIRAQLIAQRESGVIPLAFIALCSKRPITDINSFVVFDEQADLIQDSLSHEKKLNSARFDAYRLNEAVVAKDAAVTRQAQEIARLNEVVTRQAQEIARLNQALLMITQSKWYRLGVAIQTRPLTLSGLKTILYLLVSLVLPIWMRSKLYPLVARWRQRRLYKLSGQILSQPLVNSKAYVVKQPLPIIEKRPHVVYVIANFCTGGSSRLVVDLVEHLGQHYEQSVVTSYIPIPPAYVGIDITECRFPVDEQPFVEYFARIKPALIHVHYWGDCDEPWYAKAFKAAEQLGIPVVENINTPIAPYLSSAVTRYVYVSDYVRSVFGKDDPSNLTIYPGSDLAHFYRDEDEPQAENCVGMVYRLERDKLNETSILPFIYAVKKRPETQVLIVGGGGLLAEYQRSVAEAGVAQNFEFTDYVSYEKLPELYRRMAVFVAPVWKESFGQVSPFAMNMGIPVCGYDVGAIGEIVGNPDLLAPAADAERLAEIIVRLLDSPDERKMIGKHQHQYAQAHFSVQAMIQAYSEIYQQITGAPKK